MTDRAAFEAHFKLTIRQKAKHKDGSYCDPLTQARWEGYQALLEHAYFSCEHCGAMRKVGEKYLPCCNVFLSRQRP